MPGYLALVLHAHLPFVRHPEHPRFLEESWLYEAITETYMPILEMLRGWERDRINARITICLSPTLCSMLLDPLLQSRYERRLEDLIELADREVLRLQWEPQMKRLAENYANRFRQIRSLWFACQRNLVGAFRRLQDEGRIEIITCAATHALLPLLVNSPGALRAQVLTARDHYRQCFGKDPIGFWLPECAYSPEIEWALTEAGVRWFIVESHGLLHGTPRPRYGTFSPVFTPDGLAVFGRDRDSANQVWSRLEGYPGDPRYRDFYRDIGFDLDLDYIEPFLPSPGRRGFTGIKYHAITGARGEKSHLRSFDRARSRATTRPPFHPKPTAANGQNRARNGPAAADCRAL
jgi:1,4-alpha-glucan branching enzyme